MENYLAMDWNNEAVELFFHAMQVNNSNSNSNKKKKKSNNNTSFRNNTNHNELPLEGFTRSANQALEALVKDGRTDEAIVLFERMMKKKVADAASFLVIVNAVVAGKDNDDNGDQNDENDNKEMKEYVIRLYNSALQAGCLTEELGMVTMYAVVNSQVDERLRVLRSIVDDLRKLAGMSSVKKWQRSRYFTLKQETYAGPYHARLLMWWNDEDCRDEELDVALEHLQECRCLGNTTTTTTTATSANVAMIQPNPHAIDCILQHAGHKQRNVPDSDDPNIYQQQVEERRLACTMIMQVIRCCMSSSSPQQQQQQQQYNDDYCRRLQQATEALVSLKGHDECIQLVTETLDKGWHVPPQSIEHAMVAAEEQQDAVLLQDLMSMMVVAVVDDKNNHNHNHNN
eukprot:CAMPEP_0118691410 /NCGR_PEP_ID=MMETSP0800-20121206/10666_1 /TAXON_ID=210618 ORGANISM="Striatella unipunctata, Strain CCMP2910" /NCGR_SAMPLE_ID=MMETSP0800 /ASSEMBLY_ACC=CAM_ASM_000638 /LENGTH=398 /DNA_ID=CAMNT_0006589189 /DNA_START=120 /DNA_END=1316 /DNA_ORIENTATION=+